jgi:hypothetical protein
VPLVAVSRSAETLVTVPVNLGNVGGVEAREAQVGNQPRLDAVDVGRTNLRLDHQLVVLRNDVQDRAAWRDDAADRVRHHVHDNAGHRRAHVETRVLILDRSQSLEKLIGFLLHLI